MLLIELHLSTAKPGVTPFHHISKMGETLYPVLLLRAVVQPEARRGRQNRLTVMRNELSRPNYLNWPEERGASLLTHVDRTIHPPCVCLHCPNLGFFFDFFSDQTWVLSRFQHSLDEHSFFFLQLSTQLDYIAKTCMA